MRKKHSDKSNQARCIIYVIGMNADSSANRIEQYASEHELEIVDTIIKKDRGTDELEYYLDNEAYEYIEDMEEENESENLQQTL